MAQLDLWAARARDAGAEGSLRADPVWADHAMTLLESFAGSGVSFTADDLREIVGAGPSPGALGAVFLRAAKRGRIRRIGLGRSRRLSRKGAVVSRWVGC